VTLGALAAVLAVVWIALGVTLWMLAAHVEAERVGSRRAPDRGGR
jgi:hypothetical protein